MTPATRMRRVWKLKPLPPMTGKQADEFKRALRQVLGYDDPKELEVGAIRFFPSSLQAARAVSGMDSEEAL